MCFHKQHHNPQYWDTSFANIFFKMNSAHIVSINSLAMINVPFESHLTPHVPIQTLVIVYISFEMCLALAIVYIFVKMCLDFHVLFEMLIMDYIFVKMHLTFHIFFGTLGIVYIFVRMCLALHFPFKTLAMVYIFVGMHVTFHVLFGILVMIYAPLKMCLTLGIINILIKMHLSHNNIFDVFFERHTKIDYAFQITSNMFHSNPICFGHKLVRNPHCLTISNLVHTISYMRFPITS